MANTNISSDQIRRLTNSVTLAGALAELDRSKIREGVDKNGKKYISFRGAIQCGPTSVYTRSFRAYINATKADGSDSENYTRVKEWLAKAVPMTQNKDNPTMVRVVGSLSANDYIDNTNKMQNGFEVSAQFFNDFDPNAENGGYACNIDIEGFIAGVSDEERGTDGNTRLTGRKIIRLLSMDFYRNVLDLKKIFVNQDIAEELENAGYERGATVKMYIDWEPNANEPVVSKAKSFGKVHETTNGRNYLEMVMIGGDVAYDPDSNMALSQDTARLMLTERASRLKTLEAEGYKGSSTGNGGTSTNRTGSFGKAASTAKMSPVIDDDEDFPF